MSYKYIVLAGDERQAQDWISNQRRIERDLTRRDVLVVRSVRHVMGVRLGDAEVIYTGTCFRRADLSEIELRLDVLKRLEGRP